MVPIMWKLLSEASSTLTASFQDLCRHLGQKACSEYLYLPIGNMLDDLLQVGDLLPSTTPALPTLRILWMHKQGIASFQESTASQLKSLICLYLRENSFTRVPPALALIPRLRFLDMTNNFSLELEKQDLETFKSLPHLSAVELAKNSSMPSKAWTWSNCSVKAIMFISKALPDLNISF